MNVAAPALGDLSLRERIRAAVDQAAFVDLFEGAALPISTLAVDPEPCDAPCGGTVSTEMLPVPEIMVDYVIDDSGRERRVADLLATQLRRAGIPSSSRGHTLDEFVTLVAEGGHGLYRTGWVGLAAEAESLLTPYMGGSSDNLSGYASGTFDVWLSLARRSGAAEDYSKAVVALEGDAVMVPLVRTTRRVVVSDRVAGLAFRPDGTFDAASVTVLDH